MIEDFTEFEGDEDQAIEISGELFNVISTMVQGEALQLLHNCDYNGAGAWRRLSRKYSPSTPLRAMQLMLQIASPGKAKSVKETPNIIDKWESRVLALERDLKETIDSRMKARSSYRFSQLTSRTRSFSRRTSMRSTCPRKSRSCP